MQVSSHVAATACRQEHAHTLSPKLVLTAKLCSRWQLPLWCCLRTVAVVRGHTRSVLFNQASSLSECYSQWGKKLNVTFEHTNNLLKKNCSLNLILKLLGTSPDVAVLLQRFVETYGKNTTVTTCRLALILTVSDLNFIYAL